MGTPSQSYGTSLAIWNHTDDTSERAPSITPAMQAGTRLTYPEGWKAELTWLTG